jgi:hypothetical protein
VNFDLNDENANDEMETDYHPISQVTTTSNVNSAKETFNLEVIDGESGDSSLITDDESTKDEHSKEPVSLFPSSSTKPALPTQSESVKPVSTNTIKFHSKINPKKQIELFEVNRHVNSQVTVNTAPVVQPVIEPVMKQEVQIGDKSEKELITMPQAAKKEESVNETSDNENEESCSQPLKRRRSARLCRTKEVNDTESTSEPNTNTLAVQSSTDQTPVIEKTASQSQPSSSADLKDTFATLGGDIVEKIENNSQKRNDTQVQMSQKSLASCSSTQPKKLDKAKLKQSLIKRSKRLLVKQQSTSSGKNDNAKSKKISLVKFNGTAASNGANRGGQIVKSGVTEANNKKLKSKLKTFVKNFKASIQQQQQEQQKVDEEKPTSPKRELEKPVEESTLSAKQRRELEDQAAQEKRTLRRMNKSAKRMELIQQLNAEFSQSTTVVDSVNKKETEPEDNTTKQLVAQVEQKEAVDLKKQVAEESNKMEENYDEDEDDQPLSKLAEKRKLNKQSPGLCSYIYFLLYKQQMIKSP